VIDAFLAVWDLSFQAYVQAFGDFAQEYSGFAGWIQKGSAFVTE